MPDILIGFGAGITIPFLNLYLKDRFHLDTGTIGTALAVANTLMLLGVLVCLDCRWKPASFYSVHGASCPDLRYQNRRDLLDRSLGPHEHESPLGPCLSNGMHSSQRSGHRKFALHAGLERDMDAGLFLNHKLYLSKSGLEIQSTIILRRTMNRLFFIKLMISFLFVGCAMPSIQRAIAEKKNAEATAMIQKANKKQINEMDSYGSAALHYAATSDDPNLIKMLIGKGADLNVSNGGGYVVPFEGMTPLMFAATSVGSLENVKTLVEAGADLNPRSTININALMVAGIYNQTAVAQYLMEKGTQLTAVEAGQIVELRTCNRDTGLADGYHNRGDSMIMTHMGVNSAPMYRWLYCWGRLITNKNCTVYTTSSCNSPGLDKDEYMIAYQEGFAAKNEENAAFLKGALSFLQVLQGAAISSGGNLGQAVKSTVKDSLKSTVTSTPESSPNARAPSGAAYNVVKVNNSCTCPAWAPWLKDGQCFLSEKACGKECNKCQ